MEQHEMLLMDKIDEELKKISDCDKLNAGAIEALDHLTRAKKSLLTIEAMQGGQSYGMSYGGSYEHGGSYGYDGGSSGRRSRNRMGQFSRNGGSSYGGSYDGETYDSESMKDVLDRLRNSAGDPKARRAIDRAMQELG